MGLIPGSGRPPEGGHGNSLQYSCLENPMDRGVWQAAISGIAELDTTEAPLPAHGQLRQYVHTEVILLFWYKLISLSVGGSSGHRMCRVQSGWGQCGYSTRGRQRGHFPYQGCMLSKISHPIHSSPHGVHLQVCLFLIRNIQWKAGMFQQIP